MINSRLLFATAFLGLLVTTPALAGPSGRAANAPPLVTVSPFDPVRYMGTWYEIARYPNSFERNCQGVTAEYSLRPDGKVAVLNTCRTGTKNGRARPARAVAEVMPGSNGSKLAVNFAPIPLPKGQGNYWVIYLDANYQHAVVGEPSGKYLWFLSRTPRITPAQRAILNAAAQRAGYRLDMLEEVSQP
jgi:apolipoprotein D and lipocalin family protein